MKTNLSNAYTKVNKGSETRNKNDFYPTPPLATYVLLKNTLLPFNILEPCAGRGHISRELEQNGYDVKSSDLIKYDNPLTKIETGVDFLQLTSTKGRGIVTNPPYYKDLPRKMLEHALFLTDDVAFLCRISFLEGKKRRHLFNKRPPAEIIIFSDRLNFISPDPWEEKEQIGGMMAYAWFIWHRNMNTSTQIKWVLLEDYYEEWKSKQVGREILRAS